MKQPSKLSNLWHLYVNQTTGLPVFVNSQTGQVSNELPTGMRHSILMVDDAAESDHGNVHGNRFEVNGPGSTLPREDPRGVVDPKTGIIQGPRLVSEIMPC